MRAGGWRGARVTQVRRRGVSGSVIASQARGLVSCGSALGNPQPRLGLTALHCLAALTPSSGVLSARATLSRNNGPLIARDADASRQGRALKALYPPHPSPFKSRSCQAYDTATSNLPVLRSGALGVPSPQTPWPDPFVAALVQHRHTGAHCPVDRGIIRRPAHPNTRNVSSVASTRCHEHGTRCASCCLSSRGRLRCQRLRCQRPCHALKNQRSKRKRGDLLPGRLPGQPVARLRTGQAVSQG